MNRLSALAFWLILVVGFSGCASSSANRKMGQAEIKNFETRMIDAPYDEVFSAGIEALFDLGYTITHSDKTAGIITGQKQRERNRISYGFVWYDSHVYSDPIVYTISMLIKKDTDNSTVIRIKMVEDGMPVWDRKAIDRLWVYMERQVMMETVPETLNTPVSTENAVTKKPAQLPKAVKVARAIPVARKN